MSGKRQEAQRILKEFQEPSKQNRLQPEYLAEIYCLLGEKEKAYAWLEKAYAEHDSSLLWIKCQPEFDSLSPEPRYQELLRRIGFPQ